MTDIIIVGAGMAGLSAARRFKARGLDFVLLEAASEIGGRAVTHFTPSGVAVDLGAHWLHGYDTPLKAIMDGYGLPYREDEGGTMTIYDKNGQVPESSEDWLDEIIDADLAERIKDGSAPDVPLLDLATTREGRQRLSDFGLMWDGIEPPLAPSAREFLTDENTRGGYQPEGGLAPLFAALADEAGRDRIHLNTLITSIAATAGGVEAGDSTGKVWGARHLVFTGSLGVLVSGDIAFDPPLSATMQDHLNGLLMGRMNKIVVEVDLAFFAAREIAEDSGLIIRDSRPPHYCHVRSAGEPLISLYVCGHHADLIERFTPQQALAYMRDVLAPVASLKGFEAHVIGDPIQSRWSGNLLSRGAYSSARPGHRRSGPRNEGPVWFCGDTFDERFPASLAGAFRSAEACAQQIADLY